MFWHKESVLPIHILVFVFVWVSASFSFAFQPFQLIRQQNDIFENPTVTNCDYHGAGYCSNRNARCAWSDRFNGCCYCLCDYTISTFDISTLKCRANSHFRTGCNSRFVNVYSGQPIKVLDFSRKDKAKVALQLQNVGQRDKVRCRLRGIDMFLDNGSMFQVNEKLVDVGARVNKDRIIDVKWNKVNQIMYHGKIFKVNIICEIEKKTIKLLMPECFVFKSSGTYTVLPHFSPSSTTQSSTRISTSSFLLASSSTRISTSSFLLAMSSRAVTTVNSPTSSFRPVESHLVEATPAGTFSNILMTTMGFKTELTSYGVATSIPVTLTKSTKDIELNGKMTTKELAIMPSSTLYIAEMSSTHYVDPKASKESGGHDKIAVISSAVVVCIIVILAVCLFLLWSQKRKEKTSKGQRQNHTGLCNRSMTVDDNNTMGMNHIENIYAEATDVASSKCVSEKGNHVYEYADNHVDNNYTSLDKTIVEENTHYQPLRTDHAVNLRFQPKNELSPSEQPSVTVGPGNKQNEQVYSVIEDENNPESVTPPIYQELDDFAPVDNEEPSGRVSDSQSGNKHDEQVYSVLEDENESPISEPIYHEPVETAGPIDDNISSQVPYTESDYVVVLPETSVYEKPLKVPNPNV